MKRFISIVLVVLFTVPVPAVDRLEPGDLEYAGSFLLPGWRRNPDGSEAPRWGYGVGGLTYDESRDALIGTSHYKFLGHVSWAAIPEIGERAKEIEPFRDARGALAGRPEFSGTLRLDHVGGLAVSGGRLWISYYKYYAVMGWRLIDVPTLLSQSPELDDPRGLYKPGPYGVEAYGQKRTSNYLFEIPEAWARLYVGGKRLAVGKGDGPGLSGNSHGPPIIAVSTEPGPDGVLDAVTLVHYPPHGGHFAQWSECDNWEGAVWVRGTVLLAGRRGRGETCYGTPSKCGNDCKGGTGYHCQPYGVDLILYDEDNLARSAAGEIEPHEVQPYEVMDITALLKDTCTYDIGGMAYDVRRDRVYLVQQDRENPIVHVWNVKRQDPPPPPPPPRHRVVIEVDGKAAVEFAGGTKVEALSLAIEALAKELRED